MSRVPCLVLAMLIAGAPLRAQEPAVGRCASPDSIAVRGNTRISATTIRADAGLIPRSELSFRAVQGAIRSLFATGQYSDVQILCDLDTAADRATLTIAVEERPLLAEVQVVGPDEVPSGTIEDRVDLIAGRPLDPARVDAIIQRIDSVYESRGYFLARVRPETTFVGDGQVVLTFQIEEGSRLAVSGVRVNGNETLSDRDVVKAMQTKPEGFWWWRKGHFDQEKYEQDLAEKIPTLYARRGLIDFQILDDSLTIDRDRGKALIDLTVVEGSRYRVGDFQVIGNRRFSTEEIRRFYPFGEEDPTITDRLKGLVGRGDPPNLFNRERWTEATQRLQTAYSNEGYIYARINPVVDRQLGPDSISIVNLRWEIEEQRPAIINRVEIAGNDYTVEACIRDQLLVVPGDVFNQDRLIRSYQSIANMGFFETPLPPPDTRTANEEGDVDIVFRVKEKRTGNINFGASVGQGTGVGGFIGLDQPNLFGRCKRGSLQWQFGRYINDFNLSYTDPSIQQSRISGTLSAYRTQSRFIIEDLGRSTRTGGQLQLGFPVPWSRFTRVFASYGAEAVRYAGDENDLLGTVAGGCDNCLRSTLGLTGTRDTRIDLPFATAGALQTLSGQFNGGPLGGTADFQRYTGEVRAYAPLGQFGGDSPGSQPIKFVLGVTARGGAVLGDPGPFFFNQQFALGGVQFGEMLRGYDEFSITPLGYITETSFSRARRESFGSAFFTTTSEVGVRFNQMLYVNAFFDAGNVWSKPREFNPTRLFRGAGLGAAVITPFGPLGIDWAYGFDRVDDAGRPDPKWQFHFKLGNLF